MKIPVTSLSSFLYCPRKLFLEKVLKLRIIPREAIIKGTVRHEVQEKIFQHERDVVLRITADDGFDSIKSKLLEMYNDVLKTVVQLHRKEIDKFNLLQKIVHTNSLMINSIAKERAEIISRSKNETGKIGEELWLEIFPKIKVEISVSSDELGLIGRIDRLEIYPNKMVPVELKTGSAPKEGFWPGHKIQIGSYLLMLNERFGKKIDEARIAYLDINESRSLFLNPMLKEEVKSIVSKVKSVLESKKLPDFVKNDKKCAKCSLKEKCYNKELMNRLIEKLEYGAD